MLAATGRHTAIENGACPHQHHDWEVRDGCCRAYEQSLREGQPPRYFQIYDYGDGTAVALDFDRPNADGEVPCVAAHAGDWSNTEDVAIDFGAFFLATIKSVFEAEDTRP